MNGSNPVKDNSLTQQRIWNAQTRAFVKAVAIRTGLGFDLWLKEDEADDHGKSDDLSGHNVFAVKERLMLSYTRLIKKGLTTKQIAEACGMTEDEVRMLFTFPDQLDRFEKRLGSL